jgi:7-cyano-7-deazaguanine synthase in queuosine biosynthesis
MLKKIKILLFSSGLDSYLCAYKEKYDLFVFTAMDIPPYALIEHNHILQRVYKNSFESNNNYPVTVDNFRVVQLNISNYKEDSYFIPYRNPMIVLNVLHELYDIIENYDEIEIHIGGMKDDRVNDNNEEFANLFSQLLTYMDNKKITIKSPFNWNISKFDAVRQFVLNNKGTEIKLLEDTFSCYDPLHKMDYVDVYYHDSVYGYKSYHCFSCKACLRRNIALLGAGLVIPFNNLELINKYLSDESIPKWRKDLLDKYLTALN